MGHCILAEGMIILIGQLGVTLGHYEVHYEVDGTLGVNWLFLQPILAEGNFAIIPSAETLEVPSATPDTEVEPEELLDSEPLASCIRPLIGLDLEVWFGCFDGQKNNPAIHQLMAGKYPIIYDAFQIHPKVVVWDFFHQQYQYQMYQVSFYLGPLENIGNPRTSCKIWEPKMSPQVQWKKPL